MDQQTDGLNFVPRLLRNSSPPPISSRSRFSLTAKDSQKSLIYYNGNYEGDISMFGDRQSRLHLDTMSLIETDSETEFKKDMELFKEPKERKTIKENNICLLVVQFMMQYLPPDVVTKLTLYTEKILQSPFYAYLSICGKYFKIFCLWLMRVLIFSISKLGIMSHGLWRCRTFLRNITRRLLWWLTLAKCGDLTLFSIVFLCSPFLLVFAFIGLLLSLYSITREVAQKSWVFMRVRML